MSGERPGSVPVTPSPGDDELRTMLEGRASSVGAAAAREVLTAVRAEIAGRRGAGSEAGERGERDGRTFGLRPVRVDRPVGGRGRPGRMPWRLAVLGVAVVVAVAMLGSRLDLGPTIPDAGSSPSVTIGQIAGSNPAPSPVAILTPAELQARVASGGLDGRVVVARAQLVLDPWPCPSPVPADCFGIHVEGLDGVAVERGPSITADAITAHLATDAPIALRVTGGSLSLLGWVVAGVDGGLPPSALGASAPGLDRFDLALVGGWLLPKPSDPPCIRLALCVAWPRLTDSDPFIGGAPAYDTPGVTVGVDATLRLDDPAQFMVGQFLVESMGSSESLLPPYRVVATLDAEVRRLDQQVAPIGASPAPTPSATSTDGHMTAAAFERAVRLGEFDERVVVVEGRMSLAAGRCLGTAEDCTWFKVEGLDEVFIDKGDLDVDEAGAAIRRHPNVAPIALRVRGYGVGLIGWITAGAFTPVDIPALLAGDLALQAGDVVAVNGWVIGPGSTTGCPSAAGSRTCPGAWPWLTASEPLPDGTALHGSVGTDIEVADSLGLGPAPAEIAGPFLVVARRAPVAGEPSFAIVDRFVDVVVVDPVPSESASPPASPTPTPSRATPTHDPSRSITNDELMTALGNASLDGRLLVIDAELKTVAWPCPADLPEPCSRFWVGGLPGIALTYSGVIAGSDGSDGGAGVSAMTGRMVVVPRNGHLELLGRLDGDLGTPVSVGPELTLADPDPLGLRTVNGWLVRTPAPSGCPPGVSNADVSCTGTRTSSARSHPVASRCRRGAADGGRAADGRPGLEGLAPSRAGRSWSGRGMTSSPAPQVPTACTARATCGRSSPATTRPRSGP